MVRLVFRPYTHVQRSICTSEPLRASTRVSPGFALSKHSSPSFGSQHMCFISATDRGLCRTITKTNYFHSASLLTKVRLAHRLDSLVRVSRRDVLTTVLVLASPGSSPRRPLQATQRFLNQDRSGRTIVATTVPS